MKKLSYSKISKSVECLSALGEIRHRSLFGGYSLSIDGAVFAIVSEDNLYLRACEQSASYHLTDPQKLLTLPKRGRHVSLNYYLVDEELWQNRPLLLRLSAWSLAKAQSDKTMREKNNCMRHMPNITWSLEMLLLEAGISDGEMLKALGATAAWYRLRRIRKHLSASVLLALEGAITGTHAATIPAPRRQYLIGWAKMLAQEKALNPVLGAPDAEDGKSLVKD